jgi:O-antigen/teichoic acid export membrane protein
VTDEQTTLAAPGKPSSSVATLWARATKIDRSGSVKAMGKGAATIADQAVVSATNFVTSVLIGRVCSKDELGFYMLGFTIMLFSNGIQQALILSPYVVFSARLPGDGLRRYTGSSLIHQFGLCTVAALVLALAGVLLSLLKSWQQLDKIIWALALVMPLILLREFARQVSFARLQVGVALLLDSAVFIVQAGGLLILAHYGALSSSRAYCLMGGACGVTSLVWLFRSRHQFAFSLDQVVPDLQQNWRLARWLFASTFARAGSSQMYPWILTAFHGAAATGVLAACRGVLFSANPFLIGLQNFLGPKSAHEFHHNGPNGLYRMVTRAVLIVAAVMGVFCAIMLVFGGVFLKTLYGEKYAGYGMVIGVLALGQLVSAMNTPLTSGLLAMERSDVEFKGYLMALAVMLTGGVWLVKSYGALGAGCGLLAGAVASAAYAWIAFEKQRQIHRAGPVIALGLLPEKEISSNSGI